ncbi:hypothetical protein MMC22_003620 [Lobaria immixta]|nr:hypothetical protein [Lobaria immixta]
MKEANDQSIVNLIAPDQELEVDKAISTNGAVAKVISKSSGPGLLELPPEIRLMIFRHLLVFPNPLPDFTPNSNEPFPDLSILSTSKLIYKEAFDVLYKENCFNCSFWQPPFPITRSPRTIDTIQNIQTQVFLGTTTWGFKVLRTETPVFVKLGQFVGNHSITRHHLVLVLYVGRIGPRHLKWLVGALGGYLNFRTIQLNIHEHGIPHNNFFEWCEHLKTALEPMLGFAEKFVIENWLPTAIILRFHLVDPQNHLREAHDDDYDYLDGIRLGWSETLIDADDSGRLIQN